MAVFSILWSHITWILLTLVFLKMSHDFLFLLGVWQASPEILKMAMPDSGQIGLILALLTGLAVGMWIILSGKKK